ncbi:MAG: hypothetical protein ABIH25_00070 [Candidatus Woesearchaeota archaeon]
MKNQRRKILDWVWIKQNFWNVVLIWIIWQIIVAVIFAIITQLFGIPIA